LAETPAPYFRLAGADQSAGRKDETPIRGILDYKKKISMPNPMTISTKLGQPVLSRNIKVETNEAK
jgi:hypothetical protein